MPLPLRYNLRNLRVRWKTTLLAVAGIGLVVMVFVVMLSMSAGFRRALAATGVPENGIFVQKGAQSELASGIGRDEARALMADDRVARGVDGVPLASPEVVVIVSLPRKADGVATNVLLRGVSPRAYQVRRGVRLVAGRRPTPGLLEVMIGQRMQQRIGLGPGATLRMQKRPFTVVGVFESGGTGFESEIWGDVDVFAQAFHRQGGYQSIAVRLRNPAELPGFAAEIERNPRQRAQLKSERQFYTEQAGTMGATLLAFASFVSFIMGIGAVFGAMNTMYGIVAARTREVGTLRALGFSRRSILASFVLESLALAAAGGLLGCLLALPANGMSSAVGSENFSELIFDFRVTRGGLVAGMVFALTMGFAGGLLPALRAARLPVVTALRSN